MDRPMPQDEQRIYPHPAFDLAYTLQGHKTYINEIDISQDCRILASASKDGNVRLWFVEDGRLFGILTYDRSVECIAWSPDGEILASATNNAIYFYNIKTRKEDQIKIESSKGILSIDWSPNGQILAIVFRDLIRLWDVSLGKFLNNFESEDIKCIAWSPTGSYLAFGASKGTYVLDAENFRQVKVFENQPKHEEQSLLMGERFSYDDIYAEVSNVGEKRADYHQLEQITSIVLSLKRNLRHLKVLRRKFILNDRLDDKFIVENALDSIEALSKNVKKLNETVISIYLNQEDIPEFIGTVGYLEFQLSHYRISNSFNFDLSALIEIEEMVYALIELLRNGQRDYRKKNYHSDKFDNILNNSFSKGKFSRPSGSIGKITSITWSPNGIFLALGLSNCTICIKDIKNQQPDQVLESHVDPSISMKYLDNGRLLASLSNTGTLLIWRTDTWNEVAHMDGIGNQNINNNITSTLSLPILCTPGKTLYSIKIWNLNFIWLRSAESAKPTIHYVNAKAVLLGDSSVGKSGLGIRIAEKTFRVTLSTHGAQFCFVYHIY